MLLSLWFDYFLANKSARFSNSYMNFFFVFYEKFINLITKVKKNARR